MTTRDARLLTALGAHAQTLDVLAPEDAQQLLARWAGATTPLPAEAAEVAEQCGYLPLALALAAAKVRDGLSWKDLGGELARAKLEFLDHPYGSVFKSLSASLRVLPEAEAARYRDLSIFPEDTPVPEQVIVRLWSRAGLDDATARKLLRKLASQSLLTLVAGGARTLVALHDLQRDYLQITAEDVAGTHAHLLDACLEALLPADRIATRWAALPASEDYLWRHLLYHLVGAGQRATVRTLLLDYDWLAAKLRATDIGAVIAEFAALAPAREEPHGLVRDALLLSSHVLAARPEELAAQLAGRLGGEEAPELCALVETARASERPPALVPSWPRLTPPGGPLLRTFEADQGVVTAVAFSGDGKTGVSNSGDNTLKLWDLSTGILLRTLEGHQCAVTAVAISGDGKTCASGAGNNTLKLWDLGTGKLLRTLEGHPGAGAVRAVAISGDGKTAVSGSWDRTLKLWELGTGKLLRTLG
ncbi:MAG TPA: hypothetical protein VJN18_01440 [Polyangiaceae bacterium]|nr:hypothetical protein [Polyangiaceae bacterium]